jgi:tetratricopeptide (TPR) repeat protein
VLGGVYMYRNAFDDWLTTGRIGVESAGRAGDRAGEAAALDRLGKACFQTRRLDDAEAYHRRALSIRRELGDRFGEAVSVNALGLLGLRNRRLTEAAAHFRQGAGNFAELGERRWEALVHTNLAEALAERSEFDASIELLHQALPVFRELGDRFGEGNGLFVLAWAYRGSGRSHRRDYDR